MKQQYEGSCHCGKVRYRAAFDLHNDTSRCNCSICSKTRLWKAALDPDSFELVSGADALIEYRFASCTVQHQFCGTCGVKMFGRGEHDAKPFVVISIATIEASDADLANAKIAFQDGRHGRSVPPAETRYL
jgi:hypothetical protein